MYKYIYIYIYPPAPAYHLMDMATTMYDGHALTTFTNSVYINNIEWLVK